jgi:predicted short-subunit dehydrogenase-like oxidoreductase (DUF2520 family)
MQTKPVIAIVGAGNLASALVASLHGGYKIEGIVGRSGGRSGAASQARTQKLAKGVGARAFNELPHNLRAKVVWFCVPDSQIRKAAEAVAESVNWRGRVALHSSGALTSDEMDALRRKGAAVASVHPLMTFVRGSCPSLRGVPFAIEGDPRAVRVARQFVLDLDGHASTIRKKDKAAYHAWGTFASPLMTALMATTEQVAAAAGIPPKKARARMIPILRQTLENYAALGAAAGFSGPIVRGDVETVHRHWRVLRKVPAAQQVYRALLLAALDYLPAKNRAQLKRAVPG